MRRFKVTLTINTYDDFNPSEITIRESDVIDGFEITRDADDICDNFLMENASIDNIEEVLTN